MSGKNMFRLNSEGAIQEIYTTQGHDKVYFKIKGVKKPVEISLEEFTTLVEELPQVVYSIKMAIQESYTDYMEDVSGMIDSMLKERKEEECQ